MDFDVQKYIETIALLRKDIKARDNDLQLAGTFGKQLLEEKDEINQKLQQANSRLEILEQEKHSLQLDLETKIQTAKTQNSELEIQVEKVDTLEKKIAILEKNASQQKQRFTNLLREKADLENVQEDLKLENSSLKNKINILEKQIENLIEKSKQSFNETNNEEEQLDITIYINKIKDLEEALSKFQLEMESAKLTEARLVQSVRNLEEAVADRDKELSSYSTEMKRAKEYSAELQCEIEVLKLEQVDVNRRGNSMFGELDDRRKLVEKEFKLLNQKYQSMLKKYEANKTELTRCKGNMSILLSMTSKKHQDTYIEKLESMLSSARREVEVLTSKLEKATKSLQRQSAEQTSSTVDKYNYLRILNQQAQKKIKELEDDLMSTRLALRSTENKLFESHRDIYKTNNEIQELKKENMKLMNEIKNVSSSSDTFVPIKSQPNVEVIPGFESKQECQKTLEGMKENVIHKESMLNKTMETKSNRLSSIAEERNCETNTGTKNYVLKEVNEKIELSNLAVNKTNDNYISDKNRKHVNCAQQ